MTRDQQKLFNQVCDDLSRGLVWHGMRLSKDDWRHFLSGTILGWRMVPGIDLGEGPPGFVMLGRSSLDLSKEQAGKAIELGYNLGDQPWEYSPTQKNAVKWSDIVRLARGIGPEEL